MAPIQDNAVQPKSSRLKDRRIAVGVCGAIGVVEVVKIIRELRRHGATVRAFANPSVSQFMTLLPLEWATGQKVVAQADAWVEHLEDYDAVVVAPLTLNSLSKLASGQADSPVTLLGAAQLGARRPLVLYPTWNDRLGAHPAVGPAKTTLREWGAAFPEPLCEEGRVKMPAPESVVDAVEGALR